MNIVEVEDLTKKFSPPKGLMRLVAKSPLEKEIVAVDHVSFSARKGEVLVLVGPNGAGKTTLIKILCTLIWPSSGQVTINGHDLVREEDKVKASIGFVSGEERSFFWRLTGRENLEFFASLHGLAGQQGQKKIDELLDIVGLSDVSNNMFYSYSSGLKQRLAIARALLAGPLILFMDEPTKSVDAAAAASLWEFLREIAEERRITIILASHHLAEVERICDRILLMDRGRSQFCGTLDEFKKDVQTGKRFALELSGMPHEALELHLSSYPELTDISVDQDDMDLVKAEFTSLNGDSTLSRVLKNVLNSGAQVVSCRPKEVHLEELFMQQFMGGPN